MHPVVFLSHTLDERPLSSLPHEPDQAVRWIVIERIFQFIYSSQKTCGKLTDAIHGYASTAQRKHQFTCRSLAYSAWQEIKFHS